MSNKAVELKATSAAILFAALGDETRLLLLRRLSQDGPASISVLADRFRLTRQGVTKHLRVLASARIIRGHRKGRERIWELNPDRLAEARRHLDAIAYRWDEALARLKAHIENA
jgi:DNA-binding transcriptional ArsR family regulator